MSRCWWDYQTWYCHVIQAKQLLSCCSDLFRDDICHSPMSMLWSRGNLDKASPQKPELVVTTSYKSICAWMELLISKLNDLPKVSFTFFQFKKRFLFRNVWAGNTVLLPSPSLSFFHKCQHLAHRKRNCLMTCSQLKSMCQQHLEHFLKREKCNIALSNTET